MPANFRLLPSGIVLSFFEAMFWVFEAMLWVFNNVSSSSDFIILTFQTIPSVMKNKM